MIVSVLTEILLDMTRINREYLKVRILRLADLKSTGSPDELAFRFGISKRSIKRIVGDLNPRVDVIY